MQGRREVLEIGDIVTVKKYGKKDGYLLVDVKNIL